MLVYSVKIPLEGSKASLDDIETVRQSIQKLLTDSNIMPEDAEFFPLEIQVETEPGKTALERNVLKWVAMHRKYIKNCADCPLVDCCDGTGLAIGIIPLEDLEIPDNGTEPEEGGN